MFRASATRRRTAKEIFNDFLQQCSAHGISHAVAAPTRRLTKFWTVVFIICMILLSLQLYNVLMDYFAYATTVHIELKFEKSLFPAVTLCNLNPFKNSLMKQQGGSIGSTMGAFNDALGGSTVGKARRKRDTPQATNPGDYRYWPVFSKCACDVSISTGLRKPGTSCLPIYQATAGLAFLLLEGGRNNPYRQSQCICQYDVRQKAPWPCYPAVTWVGHQCSHCEPNGKCPRHSATRAELNRDRNDLQPNNGSRRNTGLESQCFCQPEMAECLEKAMEVIPHIDDGAAAHQVPTDDRPTTTTTTTTRAPDVVEALGYEGMTDEVAIVSKGRENLVFAVAGLPSETRRELSYSRDEFVLKCSFNGHQCDIENDFEQFLDAAYGNCYTFNWNKSSELVASRAGANYGLRVLLYANVSDYMPTTEAAGVRLIVHDKDQVPFPDSFGSSAPTGFITSFGIKNKHVHRLPSPYGNCQEKSIVPGNFIYLGYNYSMEGCHRSCFQEKLVRNCSCGDPRFPVLEGNVTCNAENNTARKCLEETTVTLAQGDEAFKDCDCAQPCKESAYELSLSLAQWPSGAAKVAECTPDDNLCIERYRTHAAMAQVFYEELNYELLSELPAYPFTMVIANFGGLMGLWLGLSIISLMEVFVFLYNLLFACYSEKKGKRVNVNGDYGKAHNHLPSYNPEEDFECMCECDEDGTVRMSADCKEHGLMVRR